MVSGEVSAHTGKATPRLLTEKHVILVKKGIQESTYLTALHLMSPDAAKLFLTSSGSSSFKGPNKA